MLFVSNVTLTGVNSGLKFISNSENDQIIDLFDARDSICFLICPFGLGRAGCVAVETLINHADR